MAPKQVIDTASDLGTIVQSIGYARDFVRWFYGHVKAESLAMQLHLDAYRLALKKMSYFLLSY
ncbi:hypothetical protein GCM10010967_57970 [Dyadobacter beijingensis]|uniref:HEPN domain-containing protein n=1 Tax=Dyadobacter beijingensis TaxID=365489 RepID=A0ABQ2IKL0_9BACT|nr:hypothetical protein GCM10010967_57970 [Dyadobacter beijingensis]